MTDKESIGLEELFASLIEIDAIERRSALRALMEQDREKALRLAALLDAHDNETLALDALPQLALDQFMERPETLLIGTEIGGWTLTDALGQGGMGVVFGVERSLEGVTQRAAMKLLSIPAFDSIAGTRFIREVGVLARLDHPGICRLLDWGTSDQGWRYLVLERIDGEPIDEFARSLSLTERIDLVRRVAEAVNAAHRDLVVHLDIKPANILVNQVQGPVLLDFGIARILADDEASATATVTRWLTPNYASPEQLRGEPASVAADIYALGVVLFELLVGRRPYDLSGKSLNETLEQVERASALGAMKTARLGADIQAVISQAMHPDPNRRYASAQALADDLRAVIDRRPVSARPDSAAYRFRKLWARNPIALPSAMAAIVSISVLAVLLLFQSADLQNQRDRANREAASATAANDLLLSAIESANPTGGSAAATSVEDFLQAATQRAEAAAQNDPRLAADVLNGVAEIRSVLAEHDVAIDLFRRALATIDAGPVVDADLRARTLAGLLGSLRQTENRAQAHALIEQELARNDGPLPWQLLIEQGQLFNAEGRAEEARALLEQAYERVPDERFDARSFVASAIGSVYFLLGQPARGLEWQQQAVALARVPPIDEEALALALLNMSNRLSRLGRTEEALAAAQESIDLRVGVFGAEHVRTIPSYINLAYVYMDAGRWDEAIAQAREAIRLYDRLGVTDSRDLAAAFGALGLAAERKGDSETAIEGFSSALDIQQRILPGNHPQIAVTRGNLASRLIAEGQTARGLALLEQAWQVHDELTEGAPSRPKAFVEVNIADAMLRLGRDADALEWAATALAGAEQVIEADQWVLGHFRNVHAQALRSNGRLDQALEAALQAEEIYKASTVPVRPQSLRDNRDNLAQIYEAMGQSESARRYQEMLADDSG
jgi:serine/threonine-protein kinase